MSYDLALFDPAVAPKDRARFFAWFEEQVKWDKGMILSLPAQRLRSYRRVFLN